MQYFNELMNIIDDMIPEIKDDAPNLYAHISQYKAKIEQKSEIANIKFEENEFSCDDLCTLT